MLNNIVKEQIETDERFGLHDYVDISISNEGRVLAVKCLVKMKQNVCHAALIQ